MKLSKLSALAVLAVVSACTTVNVDPSGNKSSEQVPTAGPDPAQEPDPSKDSGSQSTADGATATPGDSGGPGTDASGPGTDASGGGGIDGGGGGTDASGGGIDGGGGVDANGGGGDAGAVTSNTQNWNGWNSTTTCPPWNPAPYSWKAPRTSGVGTKSCNSEVTSFYDAYLGPSASPAAQAAWDASFAACKICVFSNWNDASWGPVVRTPNGHLVLNQAGCYAATDPGRLSCAHSSWNYQQCGQEACDTAGSQSAYQTCLATSGGAMNATCGNAAYGKGMADNTLFTANSPAWNACYATGFADNEKQTAIRVLLAFCY